MGLSMQRKSYPKITLTFGVANRTEEKGISDLRLEVYSDQRREMKKKKERLYNERGT
jgi:hypothetical protein